MPEEKFLAHGPDAATMEIVRKNFLDKDTDPFLFITVYFPKTSDRGVRVSHKLEFYMREDGERPDFDAWLVHMEELGWKFPNDFLDPLGSGDRGGRGECRLSPCAVGRTGRHNERT